MTIEAKTIVSALEAAIEDQRQHVVPFEEDYEAGYLDGLVRALDVVQTKAHGVPTGIRHRSSRTALRLAP
ncbi:MAG: hypothetical protein ACRELC_07525 [Gemmatimonadota bacterium]